MKEKLQIEEKLTYVVPTVMDIGDLKKQFKEPSCYISK